MIIATIFLEDRGVALWAAQSPIGRWWQNRGPYSRPTLIVAVEGIAEDWAAYIGTDEEMIAENVYRFGEKLPKEEAERFFPSIGDGLHYRH